jgi:hypothetical protein
MAPSRRYCDTAFNKKAGVTYIETTIAIYSRRGAENAEHKYRYKGRVTRGKEKHRRYSPFSFRERAEVREDQDVG